MKAHSPSKLVFLKVVLATILEARKALHQNRLGALEPFFLGLVGVSVLIYFIHAVSPLAPFVYSLF